MTNLRAPHFGTRFFLSGVATLLLSAPQAILAAEFATQKSKATTQSSLVVNDPSFDFDELLERVQKNDPEAEWFLAEVLSHEILMPKAPKDPTKAVGFYRRAAEQGLTKAQYELAFAYLHGIGVQKSSREAALWFRKLADAEGCPDSAMVSIAQQTLGALYEDGDGVVQDYAEAALWYRKAAARGNVRAQVALGEMHATGKGVVQDFVEAHVWLNVAAAIASPPAPHVGRARNELGVDLTSEQLAEAQRRASDWMSKHPILSSSEYSEMVTKADDPSLPRFRKFWNVLSATTHLTLSRQSGGDVSDTGAKK